MARMILYCDNKALSRQLVKELRAMGYDVKRESQSGPPLALYRGGIYSGHSDIRRNLLSKTLLPAHK